MMDCLSIKQLPGRAFIEGIDDDLVTNFDAGFGGVGLFADRLDDARHLVAGIER